MYSNHLTSEQIQLAQSSFITKVYSWMCLALIVTGCVSVYTAATPELVEMIFSSRIVFYAIILGELGLVIYISKRIGKMDATTAVVLFMVYAVLNGLTLSMIFLIYTASSVATTFFVTAGTFGIMSAYGYFTKKDLTSWGNLLFMALIGIIIASVVNMFLQSGMMSLIISIVGVLVFVGLTAYDTQKIKAMAGAAEEGSDGEKKVAIMGALTLYLDFINMFLFLMRLLGDRR